MDSKGKNIVDFASARKNLRKIKKAGARNAKEAQATENRIKFGRTGPEKKRAKLEQARKERIIGEHSLKAPRSDENKINEEDEDDRRD